MSEGGLIEKEEMFKCYVLLINRSHAKLYKGGKYGVKTGSVGFWRFTRFRFVLPDKLKTVDLDRSSMFKKNRSVPLVIVNDLTKTALSISLSGGKDSIQVKEESDPDTATKLSLLAKKSFWMAFGEQLKIGLGQTFIYFLAGFALFRFIEYVISIFTGKGL